MATHLPPHSGSHAAGATTPPLDAPGATAASQVQVGAPAPANAGAPPHGRPQQGPGPGPGPGPGADNPYARLVVGTVAATKATKQSLDAILGSLGELNALIQPGMIDARNFTQWAPQGINLASIYEFAAGVAHFSGGSYSKSAGLISFCTLLASILASSLRLPPGVEGDAAASDAVAGGPPAADAQAHISIGLGNFLAKTTSRWLATALGLSMTHPRTDLSLSLVQALARSTSCALRRRFPSANSLRVDYPAVYAAQPIFLFAECAVPVAVLPAVAYALRLPAEWLLSVRTDPATGRMVSADMEEKIRQASTAGPRPVVFACVASGAGDSLSAIRETVRRVAPDTGVPLWVHSHGSSVALPLPPAGGVAPAGAEPKASAIPSPYDASADALSFHIHDLLDSICPSLVAMFVRSHSTESAGAPATAEDEEDFLDLADEYSMLLQSFPLYVTLQAMGQKDMVRHLARSMEAVMRFVPSDGAPTATYLGPAPAAGSVSPAAVTVPPSLKYLSFAIGPELLPGAGADPLAGAHLTKALYGKLVREAAAGAPWAALTLELQSQPAAPDGRGVFIRLDPCRPTHPHALAELSKAVARITPLLLVAYSSGSQGGASGAVDSTASPAGAGSAPAGATAASTGPIEGAPAAGARFDAKGCFLRACREHTCLDVFTPGDQHRMNPLYLGAVRYIPPILGDQSSPSVAALAKEIDALNAQLFERMSTADASRSFLLSRLPSADGQVFITCGPNLAELDSETSIRALVGQLVDLGAAVEASTKFVETHLGQLVLKGIREAEMSISTHNNQPGYEPVVLASAAAAAGFVSGVVRGLPVVGSLWGWAADTALSAASTAATAAGIIEPPTPPVGSSFSLKSARLESTDQMARSNGTNTPVMGDPAPPDPAASMPASTQAATPPISGVDAAAGAPSANPASVPGASVARPSAGAAAVAVAAATTAAVSAESAAAAGNAPAKDASAGAPPASWTPTAVESSTVLGLIGARPAWTRAVEEFESSESDNAAELVSFRKFDDLIRTSLAGKLGQAAVLHSADQPGFPRLDALFAPAGAAAGEPLSTFDYSAALLAGVAGLRAALGDAPTGPPSIVYTCEVDQQTTGHVSLMIVPASPDEPVTFVSATFIGALFPVIFVGRLAMADLAAGLVLDTPGEGPPAGPGSLFLVSPSLRAAPTGSAVVLRAPVAADAAALRARALSGRLRHFSGPGSAPWNFLKHPLFTGGAPRPAADGRPAGQVDHADGGHGGQDDEDDGPTDGADEDRYSTAGYDLLLREQLDFYVFNPPISPPLGFAVVSHAVGMALLRCAHGSQAVFTITFATDPAHSSRRLLVVSRGRDLSRAVVDVITAAYRGTPASS